MALIHEWLFDETSGTVATDNVGSVNGTITGGVTLNQPSNSAATGLNTAFDFDGVDGVINFGDNLNFDRADPFTFSVWVNTPAVQFGAILSSLSPVAGFEFALRSAGKVQLALKSTGGAGEAVINTATNYPVGSWFLLTATYNGNGSTSGIKIYINGVDAGVSFNLDTMAASGNMFDSTPVQVGTRGDGSNPAHLDATIDNLRVYNIALTPAEVLAEYNVYFQAAPALIHEWLFDETSGTVAADNIGSIGLAVGNNVSINQSGLTPTTNTCYSLPGGSLGDSVRVSSGNTNDLAIDLDQPFSFSVIIQTTAHKSNNVIAGRFFTSGWQLFDVNGQIGFFMRDSLLNNFRVDSTSVLNLNQAYVVRVSYDGSGNQNGVKIFIDGVEETNIVTASGQLVNFTVQSGPSIEFAIGGISISNSATYSGLIDNPRFYNTTSTQAEALAEYNAYFPQTNTVNNFFSTQTYSLLTSRTNNKLQDQSYNLLAPVNNNFVLDQQHSLLGILIKSAILDQKYDLLAPEQRDFIKDQLYSLLAPSQDNMTLGQQWQLLAATTEIIQELINLNDSIAVLNILLVSEGVVLNDVISSRIDPLIKEAINVTSTFSAPGIFNNLLKSQISVDNLIKLLFPVLVQEDITIDDVVVDSRLLISLISEAIDVNDTPTSQISAVESVIDSAIISDLVIAGFLGAVSESISVNDVVTDTLARYATILANITVSLQSTETVGVLSTVSEDVVLDNSLSSSATLSEILKEDITLLTLPPNILGDGNNISRTGFVMNPNTFSVWNYDNYDFNSLTFWDDQGLMASSSGLYKSEGELDNNNFISSKLTTSLLDFGTSNLKQIPEVYLGLDMDGDAILLVRTEERVEATYKLVNPTTHSGLQHINVGKGLISGGFQLELIDFESTQFDLNSLEIRPVLFGRKRR